MGFKVFLLQSLAICMVATMVYGQNCANMPEGTFMPDPKSCAHYYRCIHGSPMRHNCPVGTFWSQSILACDHTWNVDCGQGTTVESTTCGPSTTPTMPTPTMPTTTISPNPTTTTSAPGTGPPSCVGIPDDGVFPHPTDCKYYYQCRNNVAILYICPDSLLFDHIKKFCSLPSLAQCFN